MNSEDAAPNHVSISLNRTWPLRFQAALLVLALSTIAGCGTAPALSEDGFQVAQTLFNICNSQNTEQLSRLHDLIEQRRDSGTLSDSESQAFDRIVKQAEQGDWDRAR